MRPRLKTALRRVRRGRRAVQFGLHPARAVVIGDLEEPLMELLGHLDGTLDLGQVIEQAAELGVEEATVRRLVEFLTEGGVLEDASAPADPLRACLPGERDRLRMEIDAIASRPGVTDGGMLTLARRRAAHVRVHGAGRVGAQIAALLAAAGVGHLCVVDPSPVTMLDVTPGGLRWDQLGRPREDAAVALAREAMPGINAWSGDGAAGPGDGPRPDLAIVCPVTPLDPARVRSLMSGGAPHLVVTALEDHATVGPLVVPGETACLRCLDLIRRDRDPAWAEVAARIGGHPPGEGVSGAALAAATAGLSAGQALAFLDGERPTVMNATVDVMPDWRWRRRSWSSHPQCGCSRNDPRSLTMVA
ncbi:ThiF family adenylyltransferase [Bailinhaonella thermotolerans]|uniref:Thiamine biosynthesis protein ThiF n=1 Tax=Bailinhaonella thermotolerans TaxID=1070861 RepID=A0A3A4B7P3_9ACTN|nr:ThiF family adenylyltransferase [Bailinhaonella thermotolerans]RJL33514.1 thiamine biosynthesis protein ThiF [Bailinhaonella thermotolerans]